MFQVVLVSVILSGVARSRSPQQRAIFSVSDSVSSVLSPAAEVIAM